MTLTARKTFNISVIIPTLNESLSIADTIKSATGGAFEIIVADAGDDSTAETAQRLGCKVVRCAAGRAIQMNAGAQAATGDILLFLHSDTTLPEDFKENVTQIISQKATVCGAFRLKINFTGFAIKVLSFCTNMRAKVFGMPYGDQAYFMYKSFFCQIGGYPEVPFLEDILLIKKARMHGRIIIAESAVTTSGRRWQKHGILQTTIRNRLIICGYLLGISPERLQHWYRIGKK